MSKNPHRCNYIELKCYQWLLSKKKIICYSAYFFCLVHYLLVIIMVDYGSKCTLWSHGSNGIRGTKQLFHDSLSFLSSPHKLSSSTTRFIALLLLWENKMTKHHDNSLTHSQHNDSEDFYISVWYYDSHIARCSSAAKRKCQSKSKISRVSFIINHS